MIDSTTLAERFFDQVGLPELPQSGSKRTIPNLKYEVDGGSFGINAELIRAVVSGNALFLFHFHWITSTELSIAREGFKNFIRNYRLYPCNPPISAISGRIPDSSVFSVVESTLHDSNWKTYVELSGRTVGLDCISDSPHSEQLHQQFNGAIADVGAPFVAFNPDNPTTPLV